MPGVWFDGPALMGTEPMTTIQNGSQELMPWRTSWWAYVALALFSAACSAQRSFQAAKLPPDALAGEKQVAASHNHAEGNSHADCPDCGHDHVSAPAVASRPYQVEGAVANPGRYEVPANRELYLLDAIAVAGGTKTQWADRVRLTRPVPGKKPVVIDVSIDKARHEGKGNLLISPGDVVSVEPSMTGSLLGDIPSAVTSSVNRIVELVK